MPLIELKNVSLSFGGPPVLDHINLNIDSGERIALIGRNGTGKSTLLKLIQGTLQCDDGQLRRDAGIRIATLDQEVAFDKSGSLSEVVTEGLGETRHLLTRYQQLSHEVAQTPDDDNITRLNDLQHELEHHHAWHLQQKVETVLGRIGLDPFSSFAELSGGLKRRAMLARALVTDPDLLLLDEPTNHLDIEAICWLEDFLLSCRASLLLITHDRAFLDKLATRIIEIDRGQCSPWPAPYSAYLRRKEEKLAQEASEQQRFDKKLREEEIWVRQGIKARRTRNEGRVRALLKLREQRRLRRELQGHVALKTSEAQASGKQVIEAKELRFEYNGKVIFEDFSTKILRGDKVGIIGANGCGKSTLIQVLLGKLSPMKGRVRLGTRLEMAYFDQQRSTLKEDDTLIDFVGQGRSHIELHGRKRHVIGYLQDFLFTPARARGPISKLSGGERNRLMLARLFSFPHNLLVMDEPTNDLDMETLELLEDLLVGYSGTLLLVSHDRTFIDNIVTSTLVFEEPGKIREYVGGYEDWLRQRTRPEKPQQTIKTNKRRPTKKKPEKLSYRDAKELEELPGLIEDLESSITAIQENLANPDYYSAATDQRIQETRKTLHTLEASLSEKYERWEALEKMQKQLVSSY